MKIMPILGLITGFILSIYGIDTLLKGNWQAPNLPVEIVLLTAFGIFLFLFSWSSIGSKFR